MATRKRLSPANPGIFGESPAPAPTTPARAAPIADVAGEASARAALQELSQTLTQAREEGRMVLALPLSQIDMGYLVRDRIPTQDDDMEALLESLRSRGQQTPIEVAPLGQDRYGLISGWRRCTALRQMSQDTVLALVRQPEQSEDAYLAMVEENEIRVGLSFYERARIVARTVENRVYSSQTEALRALFASASRAKRSKVKSFVSIVEALDGVLQFPQAIGERLGLQLAKALDEDTALAGRIRQALIAQTPATPEAEQAALLTLMKPKKQSLTQPKTAKTTEKITPGLSLTSGRNAVTLTGSDVDADLQARLVAWLKSELG